MYRNEREGFYFGLIYGVLFPLDALKIPGSIYGSEFAHGADSAQTFQGRMIVNSEADSPSHATFPCRAIYAPWETQRNFAAASAA